MDRYNQSHPPSPLADVEHPGHGQLGHPNGPAHALEADGLDAPVPVVVVVRAERARARPDPAPEVAVPDHAHVVLRALEDRVHYHLFVGSEQKMWK